MKNRSSHSIWTKLERFPPVVVRLLATRPGARRILMDDEELVNRSLGSLTLADVKQLSYTRNWDEVPVGKFILFCRACGVDFADSDRMKALTRYLNSKPKWVHLRRHERYPEFRQMMSQLFN